MKKIFTLFILLLTSAGFSQFSKTHYIPPLSSSVNVPAEEQYMYISTPSIVPINFRIIQLGGTTILGTVSRDTPYVYEIGFGINTRLNVNSNFVNNINNNKGYIIEADDLVYVTVRVIAGNQNQAGQITSKGLAALGTRFRIGAFTNLQAPGYSESHYTFVSILATENNTTVSFSDIRPGVILLNNELVGNTPLPVVLNSGESFVMAVQGPDNANRDGLIGSLVTSDKPIALVCGSYGGTNGEMSNLDIGFDQIVSAERTGKEFIFIKSTGLNNVERVLIVADQDNTEIFLNGSATPNFTINAGDYIPINGTSYTTAGNMFVRTSKDVFAYQSIGDNGRSDQANQEMFFVPPLSCQTPKVINNIPFLEQIGNRNFTGRVTIVAETNATLTFIINGTDYTLTTLPTGIVVDGPTNVTGNTNYETYTITGLAGNVSVFSTSQLYLASYGSSDAATFGGFYSGFTFKPEITFDQVDVTQSNCIPNVALGVSTLTAFDTFQWYFNDIAILGETGSTLNPTLPGYYFVSATISACGTTLISDKIPVSSCPEDSDNDGVNDNYDSDTDNDGITNCNESLGNKNIDLTNPNSGSITAGTYSNSYTGIISFGGSGIPSTTPVTGFSDGHFVTEASEGKLNTVSYTLNFPQPISLSLEYATVAAVSDLFSSDTEMIISCPVNKTLTILNPNDQVLIDTNYDGIYENGITQFSSFEIRFRLNSTTPLAAGTGSFRILSSQINAISITNKNLSDLNFSRIALKMIAVCLPKDTDGDNIPNQFDFDSDNDSILDNVESQGLNFIALTNIDTNNDGIDDAFGNGINPSDTDNDNVFDLLDLDSDNDGIHDLNESGSNALDTNNNGIIDGVNFGTNGLSNALETNPDSGVLNYTLTDTDTDGIYNAIELDSDNDLCNDVIEAGYSDTNFDGILGNTIPTIVNPNGIVTNGTGYSNPNNNYTVAAPITINTQPVDRITCELESTTFTLVSSSVDTYQWQLSTNGGTTWTTIVNNATYSGSNSITLTVSNVTPAMVGYKYRVFINKIGNSCGLLSADATLTTYARPVINTPITLVQCDEDTDEISTFNLTQKNNVISANYLTETFTYYTTSAAAAIQNAAFLISNPLAYTTSNATVFARVENSNGCFRVAQLNLIISVTDIPASFQIPTLYKCDDYLDVVNDDRDGVSSFNFSTVAATILAVLPPPTSNYNVKFYKNEADANAETDGSGNSLAITNTSNYRNIGYPNSQTIWARVESNFDNSCYGNETFDLVVEPLPVANPLNSLNLIRHCDDNQDGIYGFDTSTFQATVLNGQTGVNVTYYRANGTQILPFTNPYFVNGTETITIRVTNNSTQTGGQPCYDEVSLQFIVDDLPEAFSVVADFTTICDDELDPLNQDGLYSFDTSSFLATIIGSQTGMNVYYYDQNNVIITSTLPNQLPNQFITSTQNVRAVVENPINTDCKGEVIIPFIVNPTPRISIKDRQLICLPETQTILDSAIQDGTSASDYTYQWYFNGTILTGQTNETVVATNDGVYSVEVTNTFNCPKTREITVETSQIAQVLDVTVTDLVDLNTILVTVSGFGEYEYALDDINGPYRDSNLFYNVPMGIHEIYIRDKNGCGVVGPIRIPVLGIPQYFTPNGDGFHDYWNVKGVSAEFNYLSTIYIFDRFGKLLKQLGTTGLGWDGTYNGQLMPADDYWFTVQFEDGRSAKGHFALKR